MITIIVYSNVKLCSKTFDICFWYLAKIIFQIAHLLWVVWILTNDELKNARKIDHLWEVIDWKTQPRDKV